MVLTILYKYILNAVEMLKDFSETDLYKFHKNIKSSLHFFYLSFIGIKRLFYSICEKYSLPLEYKFTSIYIFDWIQL